MSIDAAPTEPAAPDGLGSRRSLGHPPSMALMTDHYELTMLDALIKAGRAEHRAVFETFCRRLPTGRAYGVVAGTGVLLDLLDRFTFGPQELDYLSAHGVVSGDTLDWLAQYEFRGTIDGYSEGELFFAHSPVLTVEATLGQALILETLILSSLNYDSAVASAAARIVAAAGGRSVMEAGSRRVRPSAAVGAARAAYIAGVDVTSNLEAGRSWAVPTAGTASHAFTMAFPTESDAFQAQVDAVGCNSTFLVDTYDIEQGIRAAVAVTHARLGAIRIDSGDVGLEAKRARVVLDELGATQTKIMVSGDLDEYRIAELADMPIDAFESGNRLVTGSGHPSAGFVYKLVAVADRPGPTESLRPVEKRSAGKSSWGGRKDARRRLAGAVATEELIVVRSGCAAEPVASDARDLQRAFVSDGVRVEAPTVDDARDHMRMVLAELPESFRTGDHDTPAIGTTVRPALQGSCCG